MHYSYHRFSLYKFDEEMKSKVTYEWQQKPQMNTIQNEIEELKVAFEFLWALHEWPAIVIADIVIVVGKLMEGRLD